uniref:Uncharacterized protein n=1 Tax=Onchocerca volvulus TaxID=6282 RepID=A0A2K6WDP5_ONCVO
MHYAVALSFLLQLLLCAQMHLCQKTKKVVTTEAPRPVVERGSFASPNCCSTPWKFNSATGQCILDMVAQGVKDKDMARLCTALGFELEGGNCIRYVRLLYKYETK